MGQQVPVAVQAGERAGATGRGVHCLEGQALKVGRAWAIKEALRCLWHYVYPASGWKFWKQWYFWVTHSLLVPIRKAAETIRRHIENILTYYQHPVTNTMSEGLNSKIQKIKSMACGFHNIENFKTAIYFPCGGFDLRNGSGWLDSFVHFLSGASRVLPMRR